MPLDRPDFTKSRSRAAFAGLSELSELHAETKQHMTMMASFMNKSSGEFDIVKLKLNQASLSTLDEEI